MPCGPSGTILVPVMFFSIVLRPRAGPADHGHGHAWAADRAPRHEKCAPREAKHGCVCCDEDNVIGWVTAQKNAGHWSHQISKTLSTHIRFSLERAVRASAAGRRGAHGAVYADLVASQICVLVYSCGEANNCVSPHAATRALRRGGLRWRSWLLAALRTLSTSITAR